MVKDMSFWYSAGNGTHIHSSDVLAVLHLHPQIHPPPLVHATPFCVLEADTLRATSWLLAIWLLAGLPHGMLWQGMGGENGWYVFPCPFPVLHHISDRVWDSQQLQLLPGAPFP